jgi:hypothetical protein
MKKTGDPDIKKAYRKHKHHLQKLTRQAYWPNSLEVKVVLWENADLNCWFRMLDFAIGSQYSLPFSLSDGA